ncbi:MAG: NAD(P)/FAD-dependent oxidoreductase [Thermoleophilia bacterium]|nr:NAD(P)/FAD-dependent oxidoreductase [Thermoleophilia bacterium]
MSSKTDWDAIVIGAGLAGLSCAAYLARAGRRVVVLEQHCRPGGLWTSFSRNGIIFDLSTHWVTDPRALNSMLDDLGCPPVEFVQLENLGRYVGPTGSAGSASPAGATVPARAAAEPSWDILVGSDAEAFKESVRSSFPTVDERVLEKLVQTALGFSRTVDSLPVYSAELSSLWTRLSATLSALPHALQLRRLSRTPAEEYFTQLFPGDELAGLRAALCCLAPISGIPAAGPLAILGIGLRGKAYSPKGGSQVLADAFAEAAVRRGAEIRYSQKVVSILTADRAVRGVALENGDELHAPAVVSAVDAKQTFYQLLGRDKVPESHKKALEAQPVSEPYGLISLVTTLDPGVAGFDGVDVFACSSTDVSSIFASKEPADCSFLLVFPRSTEPGADTSLRGVQVVVPAAWAWQEHWETWPTPERGAAYRALKEQWAAKILPRVQEYFPKLASHLVVVDISTPISFYRYTLNTEGAPVGWHYASRRRWKQRVRFMQGLYQAGHWVGPSGAVPVTRSGRWAAELVLRQLGKRA